MSSLPSSDDVGRLVDVMRAAGLHVDWHRSGAPRPLSSVASLAAYRIVQEGLTNAAKHGDGSVVLATTWADDGLTIRLENATTGVADETGTGLGLVGMRERAAATGGRLSIDAGTDRFVVEAWLPVDGEVGS